MFYAFYEGNYWQGLHIFEDGSADLASLFDTSMGVIAPPNKWSKVEGQKEDLIKEAVKFYWNAWPPSVKRG